MKKYYESNRSIPEFFETNSVDCGPDLAGETTAIEFGRTLLLLSIALVYQLLAVDTRMLSDILILREK